jgi:hypothetical protein
LIKATLMMKLLGGWVKNQREYKKKLDRGEPSL